MVVVDASVVVKWFVEEELTDDATAIRDAYVDGAIDLSAPSLLPYEVGNVLRFSGGFDDDRLDDVSTALSKYDLNLVGYEAIEDVTAIALDGDITVYDAAYVALAETLDEPLYTTDERLLEDVGSLADCARHLSDFS